MQHASGQPTAVIGMNVPPALVHTPPHNVLRYKTVKEIQKNPKALSPVKLLGLLPWLVDYPDQQKAELIYQGFHVPEFQGPACVIVENSKCV